MLPHLTEIAPSTASPFGVRIIHNTVLNLLYIGCVATATCEYDCADIAPAPSTNRYIHKCKTCGHFYTVRVPGLTTVFEDIEEGRDLDRWVAVWLGHDTDDVGVIVKK